MLTYKGYDKKILTKDWLSMTNDDFFDKYGFNYIPSQQMKNKTYKERKLCDTNVWYYIQKKIVREVTK